MKSAYVFGIPWQIIGSFLLAVEYSETIDKYSEIIGNSLPLVGGIDITLIIIETIIFLFGILWVVTNFYNFYPISQAIVKRAYSQFRGGGPVNAKKAVSDGGGGDGFPTIDILLPAYKEPEVIAQSIKSIRETIYPQNLLRLYVLLEPDDEETRSKVTQLKEEYQVTEVIIPPEYPGESNKPRALNYGYEYSDGDIVGLIDAEDIVEKGLLKEVAKTLRDHHFALGRLDMVNEDDGWLSSQFRGEYGGWYNFIIPSFAQTDFPVPLAGTTCFFRSEVLDDISKERVRHYGDPWSVDDWRWAREQSITGLKPWDPENVTEDFELGHFLWKEGYSIEVLESVTDEESPLTFDNWIRQRTRWKKGKMYTFIHHLKNPPQDSYKRFHLFWQSFLPHLGPVNIFGIIFVLWIANMAGYTPTPIIEWILVLGMTFTLLNIVLYSTGYLYASDKRLFTKIRRSVVIATTMPFYWVLQWYAEIRAIGQLYSGQFHWEKSKHLGRNTKSNERSPNSISREKALKYLSNSERYLALLSVVLLGFSLRVLVLDNWSLWIDEIYTITFRSSMPVSELLVIPYDPHPPLYFLLIHYWIDIFGQSAIVARTFSLTFSILSIIAIFYLGYELYDDKTGLLSALLVSVSTLHIHFGRTVRMYSLLIFLSIVSWYFFSRLHENSRIIDSLYLVSSVAVLYTHAYAVFIIAGQYVYIVLSEENNGISYKYWASLQGIVLTAYSPWIYILGRQVVEMLLSTEGGAAIGWIPQPSPALLRDTARMYGNFPSFYPILSGGDLTWILALFTLFIFLLCSFLSVATKKVDQGIEYVLENKQQSAMLICLFVLPIGLPYLISHLLVPIYYPRYTVVASIPLYLLVARGVRNIDTRKMKIVVIVILLISSFTMTMEYGAGESEEDWRGVANTLDTRVRADDVVVVQPGWIKKDIGYYYNLSNVEVIEYPFPKDVERKDRQRLKNLSQNHDRIWIVRYPWKDQIASKEALQILEKENAQLISEQHGIIRLYLYSKNENTSHSGTSTRDSECGRICAKDRR